MLAPSFCVVECQTAPNDNINKWVCVPRSWVQCEKGGEKVAVVYPAEDEICITKRITNNEPGSKAWPHYIGIIKYEAESYEDAVVGFLEKKFKQSEDNSCKNEEAVVDFVEKSVEKIEEKTCNIPECYEEAVIGFVEKKENQIEEKPCNESNEDAYVGFLEKNVQQIEEETRKIEPDVIPKDSLKLRIVLPKLNLKPDKKNKTLKKYLKEQSKDSKIHKSKLNNEEKQESKEDTPRKKKESTSDSGDSGVTEGSTRSDPRPSQSNAETSQKSLESKIEDLIIESLQKSLTEININDSPDKSRRTISECLDIEAGDEIDLSNSNLTPEDKRTVATLLINQRNTGGYIKAVLVHMKTLYIKYMEDKKTLNALVSKLKNRPSATATTEDTQPNQPSATVSTEDTQPKQPSATVSTEDTQLNEQALEEETSLSDDMETLRFDDDMDSDDEADGRTPEENGNTLMDTEDLNLLEEIDAQMEHDDSDFETFFDDKESSLSSTPSSPEPVKPKRMNSKKNRYLKNSPWSLKHPATGKGLVPFGRSNQVYIRAKKLEHVQVTSTNAKMFARELSRAIFTPEALRTCSMTGRRPYFGKNTQYVRPPLHSIAMNDIINCSVSFGVQKGWNDADKKTLIRSIRNLLQNSRRKP